MTFRSKVDSWLLLLLVSPLDKEEFMRAVQAAKA